MISPRLFLFSFLAAVLALFLLTGCSSRPAAAQKLFAKGKYQEVIARYPDLEIARRARAKIAENLLKEKQYETILKEYADTPAAFKARQAQAQALFDEGRYQAVLDSFPGTPIAAVARDRLVDSLLASGQTEIALQRFPDHVRVKQVREDQAREAYERVKKIRGKDRLSALDEFVRQYSGTQAAIEASKQASELRAAQHSKKK